MQPALGFEHVERRLLAGLGQLRRGLGAGLGALLRQGRGRGGQEEL